ncbi:MAG TPA: aldo/keto reductase [Nitrososphaerales archaeon]|nr:aldo/keto reductase [Nitrososphaerales archaeon]
MLAGHATQEGTSRFASWAIEKKGVNRDHFREFRGLRLSSVGIGTYLGDLDAETDKLVEETVFLSVSSGAVNVIDTAINYRLQRAERSVGRALARLGGEEGIEAGREALLVCTKDGYLSSDGELSTDFWAYIQDEFIKPGKLKQEEIAGEAHSMAVPFLREQLGRSLANLGLGCVDVLYLHNAAESWLPEVGYEQFLEKLREVFSLYEEERKTGRIVYYGMASWSCFRVGEGEAGHVNLEDVVEAAKSIGGEDHGFRFLQLPFNVAMNEALTQRNQRVAGEPLTTFAAARRLGVGVFTSVPLSQGRLLSHTRVPRLEGSKALSLMQFARSAHPALLAPLIGQKSAEHTSENLRIATIPPLDESGFRETYKALL